MPVLAEGLQTQGQYFIVEEKRCPTLNADDSWDDNSLGNMSDGVAYPNTLSIAVLQ